MVKLLPIFRIVALLEGLSYILLLFIASPVKWFMDEPKYVKMLGMPHGLLFIAYVVIAILLSKDMKWNNRTMRTILLASIIPFATFYVEKKFLRQDNAKH